MKKLVSVFSILAAFVAVFLFVSYVGGSESGFALAAMVPLLPRNIFSGRPSINRDINLNYGTWGAGGESLQYPIYDRMRMLNSQAVNPRTLFNTAVGGTREGSVLTFADTNIEKSESVPSSQKWILRKLTVGYIAEETRTDAEIVAILDYMRRTTFRININSKDDMLRMPMWAFFGSPQLVSAPAATINSRYPQALFTGVFTLEIPIVLQALTDWKIIVEPLVASAAGLDNDFLTFVIDSERARAD